MKAACSFLFSKSRYARILMLLIFLNFAAGLAYLSSIFSKESPTSENQAHPTKNTVVFSRLYEFSANVAQSVRSGLEPQANANHHPGKQAKKEKRPHNYHRQRGNHYVRTHRHHYRRQNYKSFHRDKTKHSQNVLFVDDSMDSYMIPGTEYAVDTHNNLDYPALRWKNSSENVMFYDVAAENPLLSLGGRHKPTERAPRAKVAIIIPYRQRWHHLRILLHHLHPVLQRQGLEYGIFIANQAGDGLFNKAALMNAAYQEVNKIDSYQCYIFHDVDLIPENYRCLYTCSKNLNEPRHISTAISKFSYRLLSGVTIGGISAFTGRQFEAVNGWSNRFEGWGGENDDMALRLKARRMRIRRPSTLVCRFTSLPHTRDKKNPLNSNRLKLLKTSRQRMAADGLNSIRYKVLGIKRFSTYTNITVDLQQINSNP